MEETNNQQQIQNIQSAHIISG